MNLVEEKNPFEGIPASPHENSPLLKNTDSQNYADMVIPSWNDLKDKYEERWRKEKEKFQNQLRANFFALVERYASSKQEIFLLTTSERREKLYTDAFLELFESGYAPHIGEVERIAGKRCRRLYVTLPINHLA